mmetsp:Transcript_21255/g.60525  ORF Transcript_21255/g.60525 Transcript_21255/m.60525 type:complete len:229 (-) Transcript_21255:162-848(-)
MSRAGTRRPEERHIRGMRVASTWWCLRWVGREQSAVRDGRRRDRMAWSRSSGDLASTSHWSAFAWICAIHRLTLARSKTGSIFSQAGTTKARQKPASPRGRSAMEPTALDDPSCRRFSSSRSTDQSKLAGKGRAGLERSAACMRSAAALSFCRKTGSDEEMSPISRTRSLCMARSVQRIMCSTMHATLAEASSSSRRPPSTQRRTEECSLRRRRVTMTWCFSCGLSVP